MITLTLLHPVQSTPVQSWSFSQDLIIRIGRAVDNQVVLYSAVVSRYHVELRNNGELWEVVNLGTNGTYLDGKRVQQAPLMDGSVMRLARSGPNIQIRIDAHHPSPPPILTSPAEVPSSVTPNPRASSPVASPIANLSISPVSPSPSEQTIPPSPHLSPPLTPTVTLTSESASVSSTERSEPYPPRIYPEIETPGEATGSTQPFQVRGTHNWPAQGQVEERPLIYACSENGPQPSIQCQKNRLGKGTLVCIDCGLPLQVVNTLGQYRVLKPLSTTQKTFVAWRDGHIVVLKALQSSTTQDPLDLQEQARWLCQLSHPGMPKIYEAFAIEGQIFLVSEMIYGQNLHQLVAGRGPLPQPQVKSWAMDICHLLDYLHHQTPPVVHQSLKPVNFIRPTIPHGLAQVVLVDFGDSVLQTSGLSVGTGGYTAPEQHTGPPTPAADLYALGTTLVYLLTKQSPDAFLRLGDQECLLSVEDMPQVSQAMAQIIQNLTCPRPEDRYPSALSVIEALKALP